MEKTPFFAIIRRKNYLLLEKIIKFGQIVLKLAQTNTKLYLRHFLRFRPKTRNMIFLRTHAKNFEKKYAQKKALGTLMKKFAYVNPIFRSFTGQIQRYFSS